MRRTSYHEKAAQIIQKSQNRTKNQIQIDQLNFRLEMNKLTNHDDTFVSSRTNRYTYYYKQPIKIAYKRPYTTQRSNSLNQMPTKKQDYDVLKQNLSLAKNHKHARDLWVSNVKDFTNNNSLHYSSKFHDPLLQKGKIHRGISLKGDDRSFLKDSSFDVKKLYQSSNTPVMEMKQSAYSASKQKRTGAIDLIGKNLKKSMNGKGNTNDNFFQYVMRFSYKTKKGYASSNPNKINQDSYITFPNIQGKSWEHLFGICDGHGPLGHLVSGFIKTSLPQCITNLKNIEKNPIYNLNKGFEHAYQKLIKQSHIDMSFSGSTVIICYFLQNKLYCCNVGDSRAILGKQRSTDKQWTAVPLSTDHKPNIPSEADRIRKMKGRVQAYRDEFGQQIGPARVWLKSDNVPGLAMSRSFGDLVAASVGVSHTPQIKQFTLSQQDKIILIGSDGVFQFLDNDQILRQLVPFYEKKQIQQASDHLLTMAHRSWNRNSSIIDDITFILVFMNYGEI